MSDEIVHHPHRIQSTAKPGDILPDSRARDPKGRILNSPMGTMVPVFCANCGREGGWCPEENMTFLFYLCNGCAEIYGKIAGMMMMPDEVFYEKVRQEQLATFGRYLAPTEIAVIVEADASPLATLLKSGR